MMEDPSGISNFSPQQAASIQKGPPSLTLVHSDPRVMFLIGEGTGQAQGQGEGERELKIAKRYQ